MRNSKGISFGFWPTFAISAGPTASKYTEVHYKKASSVKVSQILRLGGRKKKRKSSPLALHFHPTLVNGVSCMDINNILFEVHFVPFQCQCQVSGLEVNQDPYRHPPGLDTIWTGAVAQNSNLLFSCMEQKLNQILNPTYQDFITLI